MPSTQRHGPSGDRRGPPLPPPRSGLSAAEGLHRHAQDLRRLASAIGSNSGTKRFGLLASVPGETASPWRDAEAGRPVERQPQRGAGPGGGKDREAPSAPSKDRELPLPDRGRGTDRDIGL